REQAAEPALVDMEHAAALRLFGDHVLRLSLGADEKDRAAFGREAAHEFFGVAEQLHRLAQVDDVDAVSFAEDVLLHLRIPALRLVAEVNSRLQQILHRDRGQALLLYRLLNWKRLRAPAMPYFLRSLARASRVSSPSSFNFFRSSRLYSTSAREMPSRTAPACPDTPPPATVARISNLSAVSVNTNGVRICIRSASVLKNASNAR